MKHFKFFIFLLLLWVPFSQSILAETTTEAKWAKSMVSSVATYNKSQFKSTAVDSNGNIYAAGYIGTLGTYDFGNGVTVSGANDIYSNLVIVKYDSNGNVQWAKEVATLGGSEFYSVAVDSNDNIYAVGYICCGSYTFDFGNGVVINGLDNDRNVALVKYDNNGDAQWAKSVVSGSSHSELRSIVVDNTSGNIYAAGYIYDTGSFDLGNGVTVNGVIAGNSSSIVLVKYDSSGNAQWAKSAVSGSDRSDLFSLTVDSTGNVYASGVIYGAGPLGLGNGISAITGGYDGPNAIFVKYNSSGDAQWDKSVISSSNDSAFWSVNLDSNENFYLAGLVKGTNTFDFGNGVTVTGTTCSYNNLVLVKYDNTGNAEWAHSVISNAGDPGDSEFYSAAIDSDDNIYAAGHIDYTDTFDFGNEVTVSGSSTEYNIVVAKYGIPEPTPTPTPTPDVDSAKISVAKKWSAISAAGLAALFAL